MTIKAKIIAAILALLFSQFAHSSAGWTDYATVAELVPTDRHYYRFRMTVDDNPSGCRNKTWFYQDYSARGSDRIFDALLESVSSRIRLRVYVTGNCNLDGHSEISSIGIIP